MRRLQPYHYDRDVMVVGQCCPDGNEDAVSTAPRHFVLLKLNWSTLVERYQIILNATLTLSNIMFVVRSTSRTSWDMPCPTLRQLKTMEERTYAHTHIYSFEAKIPAMFHHLYSHSKAADQRTHTQGRCVSPSRSLLCV
jgi:hypothetical protein